MSNDFKYSMSEIDKFAQEISGGNKYSDEINCLILVSRKKYNATFTSISAKLKEKYGFVRSSRSLYDHYLKIVDDKRLIKMCGL